MPHGYSYKASDAILGKAVICNCWHPGTLMLSRERQSARISKITNDGLIRSGTGCFFSCTHMASVVVKALTAIDIVYTIRSITVIMHQWISLFLPVVVVRAEWKFVVETTVVNRTQTTILLSGDVIVVWWAVVGRVEWKIFPSAATHSSVAGRSDALLRKFQNVVTRRTWRWTDNHDHTCTGMHCAAN